MPGSMIATGIVFIVTGISPILDYLCFSRGIWVAGISHYHWFGVCPSYNINVPGTQAKKWKMDFSIRAHPVHHFS